MKYKKIKLRHVLIYMSMCYILSFQNITIDRTYAHSKEFFEDIQDENVEVQEYENIYKYEMNNDGENTCTLTGYSSRIYSNLFPQTIDGHIITRIGKEAFKNCIYLIDYVNIPDTVKVIEEGAFYGCENIKEIKIPKECISIGKDAFRECLNITDIYFNDKLETIGDGAFYRCEELSGDVLIPASVKKLGNEVFVKSNPRVIRFHSNVAPIITKTTFSGVDSIIVVPHLKNGYDNIIFWAKASITDECKRGDVNHDEKVNAADAAIVLDLYRNNSYNSYADVNQDGKVNSVDAAIILDLFRFGA